MGIGKRILSVLIGILFIISVSVLGGSLLAKQVLVKAISQAGIDTAISHRMMDAVFGYAGADDTQWIAKIQNKIEKNEEVQKITEKVMDEMVNDLSKGSVDWGTRLGFFQSFPVPGSGKMVLAICLRHSWR